jgi:hypothetical protein
LRDCHPFDEPIANRQILYRVLERVSVGLIAVLAGQEAHKLSLLLHLEYKSLLEHHRQPHETIRDGLYLLRLLTQMLDTLHVKCGIASVEVRLNVYQSNYPFLTRRNLSNTV